MPGINMLMWEGGAALQNAVGSPGQSSICLWLAKPTCPVGVMKTCSNEDLQQECSRLLKKGFILRECC